MDENNQNTQTTQNNVPYETVFCFNCGQKVAKLAIMCPHCGVSLQQQNQQFTQPLQQQQPQSQQPQVIINNANTNTNTNTNTNSTAPVKPRKVCNKWIAFLLCFFLGVFGAHCFYEGRVGKGILYLFTAGFCGFGVLIDWIMILCKPNPYTV